MAKFWHLCDYSDSGEAPSDQNKISPEKNKKRILKTPSQVKGLEAFYNGTVSYIISHIII